MTGRIPDPGKFGANSFTRKKTVYSIYFNGLNNLQSLQKQLIGSTTLLRLWSFLSKPSNSFFSPSYVV
jgi:hypothetical protein